MNGAKNREILDENLLQSAQTRVKVHLPTGQRMSGFGTSL
jgi:hypothetical protein